MKAMDDDLQTLVARKVDIVERKLIERSENWIRRKAILGSAQVLYEAA